MQFAELFPHLPELIARRFVELFERGELTVDLQQLRVHTRPSGRQHMRAMDIIILFFFAPIIINLNNHTHDTTQNMWTFLSIIVPFAFFILISSRDVGSSVSFWKCLFVLGVLSCSCSPATPLLKSSN